VKTCPQCGGVLPEQSRFCPSCGAPVSAAPASAERRKVVTVIFADVVGSTALGEHVDPETLRWAMQRWFDRMQEAVERHGGTVEKFIGDAVMAVFGIPVSHEDDALRAVRAAAQMRAEGTALRDELRRERGFELAVRIGVNTGEAVTGAATGGGSFTTGDTVNVAARLEQAARPGDVLVGHDTFRLVRHAVEAERVAPLTVKGKSAPLQAYRLVAVAPDAGARPARPRAPMVGRQRERRRLLDAFHQAVADRSCQLFTVLGTGGVGKSRLVAEVVETIDGAATVAAGRCLPYGDGLTWWPLVEALSDSGLLEQVGPDADEATPIVTNLLAPAGAAVAPEEAFWAVRKVLEALARRQPLVIVIDDLQWAEPTFVELVEHVADWSRDAPLLLLVMARPELLDSRPGWGGGKPNATSVLLEPLAEADAADLLAHLLGPNRLGERAATRILEVAEGNPLFVEELVAMLAEDGDLPSTVPPTIHALLAARIDRLPEQARAVLEAAAVEGKEFARERVEVLVGDSVDEQLLALVRTDLIRPAGASRGTFRFRHQLICEAAYDGMPKQMRAAMHERFADWLEEHGTNMPSVDELLGHHLERAVQLRRELGADDGAVATLAEQASASLLRAGRRATASEEPAATRLLERALALAPDAARATVLVALADALYNDGELLRAAATARDAVPLARAAGDRRTAARAQLVELRITKGHLETDLDTASVKAAVAPLIAEFEALGDDEGLAGALLFMGYVAMERSEQATGYLERALVHAERAGDRLSASWAAGSLGLIAVYSPLPVAAGIARCQALRRQVAGHRSTTAALQRHEALLLAMRGDIDDARALHDEADRVVEDLASLPMSASAVFTRANLELLAGAPARAESVARASLQAFEAMRNRNQGSTAAAFLGLALVDQGRDDEALEYADLAASWAMADDNTSHVSQLAIRARVLAGRGERAAAEAAARDAMARSGATDDPWLRCDALESLAFVLEHAGRSQQAADALRDALVLHERKGNVVAAERVRALLEAAAGVTDA
jgi:class 3 adenylate cyclase/tetratricopeptide (TPR) repeat protein